METYIKNNLNGKLYIGFKIDLIVWKHLRNVLIDGGFIV